MSYEELSIEGFLKEIKEVSDGPHPRRFCFVLGAGASISSGIKSGQELVNIWDKELLERNSVNHQKWKAELGINDENKYEYYSQYYERRFRWPGDGYNYLEKIMESANPSIGYVMLSHILTQTRNNVVITTNFDHLIENAINYYQHTIPLVIGHESLAHYVTKQVNRPMIIKIHRDLLLDPKNRTAELDKLHENWVKALNVIFSEYHPIFIGYGGNDKSLMDFLINNHEKVLNHEWTLPYWMLYKSDEISGKVLEFLNKSNGYLIKHNGFDEVMCSFGAVSNYNLPSREDFMSDAEKRFQMLSEAVNTYKEESATRKETSQKENDFVDTEPIQAGGDQTELHRLFREAVFWRNIDEYEKAVQIFRQLVEMNPKNAHYHYALGVSLHDIRRYEEALEEKQQAIKQEPENAQYHDSLSVTLHEMGRYEEALKETQRAIELEPENAQYHDSLGATLHKMGRYEEALKETQRATELEPENTEYRNHLASILQNINNTE